MQAPKTNQIAGQMILDDELRKVICKTGPKPFKPTDNKLLPRQYHSAFGDFPTSHLTKGATQV